MKFFQLEDLYVNKNSLECGLEFIENSGGTAGFPRAHYQYAAKELAKETDVIITGNFGSEVFRAAHNAGAVISPNLYHLFSSNSFDEAILKLESSPEWKWLNSSAFNEAKESLYEDLKTFPAFNKDFDGFTKNQKFYKVVFDEVFRKYFGAEIVNQFQVIKNRTPYLDIEFLKTIFASEFAGVYSDFFTHNPLKRFKGQVVYANVLKRTNPTLLKMMTDKGYRPSDILSFLGKIRITLSYIDKRIKEKGDLLYDPYSVKKSFEYNKEFWRNIKPDKQYFNIEAFETKEKQSNAYSIALSQAWWYNSIKSVI